MMMWTRPAAAFACTVAVVAQVAAQTQPPMVLAIVGMADGTRLRYEISRERAASLPTWDPRTSPEPPLSMSDARRAAQAWLAPAMAGAQRFDLQFLGISRSVPSGTWYYRIGFNPVAVGRPITDLPRFTAFVLLDGSIVERMELPAGAPATTAGGGQGNGIGRGRGAAGGPPQMPTGDTTVYRPGDDVISPRVLGQVPTQYTDAALKAKIQGTVLLEVVVNADGSVGDVKVLRSLDTVNGLDEEAIKAARRWRFAPGTRMGVPVRVAVAIEMTFSLR